MGMIRITCSYDAFAQKSQQIQASAIKKKLTVGKIDDSNLDEIGELGISIDHQPMNLEIH